MPLSEHEQRLLEQMERALYAEDPKFATSLRSTPGARAARGRAALGVLGILAGLGLLVAGVPELDFADAGQGVIRVTLTDAGVEQRMSALSHQAPQSV